MFVNKDLQTEHSLIAQPISTTN